MQKVVYKNFLIYSYFFKNHIKKRKQPTNQKIKKAITIHVKLKKYKQIAKKKEEKKKKKKKRKEKANNQQKQVIMLSSKINK